MADARELFLGEGAAGGEGSKHLHVNMGPAHPAMHGIVRIFAELDGETVVKTDVEIGYLHRAFEKDCEAGPYNNAIPYTDRLNYVSPLINNFGYSSAVEKLLGIEITERCKYIRVIMSEISRICDHLTCVGAGAMELGAFTVFLYMIKAREFLWELVEDVTGARLTISYGRVGGVKADLPAGFDLKVKKAFAETRQVLEEVHTLITGNRIFMDRMVGVGALSKEDTIAWGITGPLLRAAGVPFDLRKTQPYWAYDRIPFDIALGKNGDNFDRYLVRMAEMEQSMRIAEQALDGLPGGAIQVDWEGKAIQPDAYVDLGKQGKTEGLLLLPIKLSPNLQGQDRPVGGEHVHDEQVEAEAGQHGLDHDLTRAEPVEYLAAIQHHLERAGGEPQHGKPVPGEPQVGPLRRLLHEQRDADDGEDAERQVDVEHPAPRVEVRQIATECRTDHRAHRDAHGEDRHRLGAPRERIDVQHRRLRQRRECRAEHPLQQAKADQLLQRLRRAA